MQIFTIKQADIIRLDNLLGAYKGSYDYTKENKFFASIKLPFFNIYFVDLEDANLSISEAKILFTKQILFLVFSLSLVIFFQKLVFLFITPGYFLLTWLKLKRKIKERTLN
ncbi:MAG: hypothetical protein KDD70_08185, partial [Bdellovibrionales bacterium]|nr:hypothetical protein [Bdellovibrionales bacterium]